MRARSASSCSRLSRSVAIARDGLLDGAQQHLGVDRLGQKVFGAGLHGQDAEWECRHGRTGTRSGSACRIATSRCCSCSPVSPGMRTSSRMQPGASMCAVSRNSRPIRTARPGIRQPTSAAPPTCATTHRRRRRARCRASRSCACRPAANGKVKRITAPPCWFVLCADLAAMRFDDRARNREPQAHAVGLGRDERRRRCAAISSAGMPAPESATRDLGLLVDWRAGCESSALCFCHGLIVHGFDGVERKVQDHLLAAATRSALTCGSPVSSSALSATPLSEASLGQRTSSSRRWPRSGRCRRTSNSVLRSILRMRSMMSLARWSSRLMSARISRHFLQPRRVGA